MAQPEVRSRDSSAKARPRASGKSTRRCGLCGKSGRLARTECCGNWVCDDEDEYVLFSYARNSCYRNHRRLTLCGYHHAEEHAGGWQECSTCRQDFETEIYVYYGTNQYNFEKLANPPAYEPTSCAACGTVINLGEDGYSVRGSEYWCEGCSATELRRLQGRAAGSEPNSRLQPTAGAKSAGRRRGTRRGRARRG